jgi:hypothetical protein
MMLVWILEYERRFHFTHPLANFYCALVGEFLEGFFIQIGAMFLACMLAGLFMDYEGELGSF